MHYTKSFNVLESLTSLLPNLCYSHSYYSIVAVVVVAVVAAVVVVVFVWGGGWWRVTCLAGYDFSVDELSSRADATKGSFTSEDFVGWWLLLRNRCIFQGDFRNYHCVERYLPRWDDWFDRDLAAKHILILQRTFIEYMYQLQLTKGLYSKSKIYYF